MPYDIFAGFKALPAGAGEVAAARPWREVLGMAVIPVAVTNVLGIARARYRELMRVHHPDLGGDPTKAAELNAAMEAAEKELGS